MKLIVGMYSQLPMGTGVLVHERVLSHVLTPTFKFLFEHPQMSMLLSLTPAQLEWLRQNHPAVNMLLSDLVKRGQVEMATGPFYQSIMQLIPMKDRSAQVEKTTTYIRRKFGTRSRTLWCYQQVWNPTYINTMALCGLERLVISTSNKFTGKQAQALPFLMQETGRTIEVYPTNDLFSSMVQKYSLHQLGSATLADATGDVLRQAYAQPYSAIMINADQIAMGSSGPAEDSMQTDAWSMLQEIYSFAQEHRVPVVVPGTYSQENPIEVSRYLPAGWYGHDSEGTNGYESFNDLLVNNEELNQLYGRYLFISENIRNYKKNRDIRKLAESTLEKASCGVAFITDTVGGTLLPMHRKHIYKYFNEIEQSLCNIPDFAYPRELDIDFDRHNEFLSIGKNLSAIVDCKGAAIIELNYLPAGWNYADTYCGRSRETVGSGKKQKVFEDILFQQAPRKGSYDKYNTHECVALGQRVFDMERSDRLGNTMSGDLAVENTHIISQPLLLHKEFKFGQNTICFEATITNTGDGTLNCWYGCEMNLSVGTKNTTIPLYSFELNQAQLRQITETEGAKFKNIRLVDELNKTLVSCTSDIPFQLLKEDRYLDARTICGPERVYTHSTLVPYWNVHLAPGASALFKLAMRIERR